MDSPAIDDVAPVLSGRRLAWYVATMVCAFALVFLLTRSSILIGDAGHYMQRAESGDPARLHFGEMSHFVQVPLARALWLAAGRVGLPLSLAFVFIGISLMGTLTAIIFLGLVTAQLTRASEAAWLAAILFGTSLNISTQWNGELYGLPLGLLTAGLYFALRGRRVLATVLWSLAVLARLEFSLATPIFVAAIWMTQPSGVSVLEKGRRVAGVLLVAGSSSLALLLAGSWWLGKWTNAASLAAWAQLSFASRMPDVALHAEIGRALKGLLTAYTVSGHFWRDVLTGRGTNTPVFILACAVGLFVIVVTGLMLAMAVRRPRVFVLGLIWLLPFHIAINWWFFPTVEKYHAGALPAFVLLIVTGFVAAGDWMGTRSRTLLIGSYAAACVSLNVFGALLPMQALGRDTVRSTAAIQRLIDASAGRAVFVACDEPKVLTGGAIPYWRMRSVWVGTIPEIQRALTAWVDARLAEGREPILVGRWCLPEEWKTKASKAPFDLFFLEQSFRMVPTGIINIPTANSVPTNPFNWTRGDVVRLARR